MTPTPSNSVFNIDIEKIDPNPYQPRKFFDQDRLHDLSESIKRYGILQPITVVRKEVQKQDGGTSTRYEIIAGERRFRAAVMAGLATMPALIREGEQSNQDKLELAILENLQREDLNATDKARGFEKLAGEFGMKHNEIAQKLGKSREYVTNSLRLLLLPNEILESLSKGEITEGHARHLLSLRDKPEELHTVFQEVVLKGLNVRETEKLIKGSGIQTAAKPLYSAKASVPLDPEMQELQTSFAETLGTKVSIDKKENGGRLTIDFFSREDLKKILAMVHPEASRQKMPDQEVSSPANVPTVEVAITEPVQAPKAPTFGSPIDTNKITQGRIPEDKVTQGLGERKEVDLGSFDFSAKERIFQKQAQKLRQQNEDYIEGADSFISDDVQVPATATPSPVLAQEPVATPTATPSVDPFASQPEALAAVTSVAAEPMSAPAFVSTPTPMPEAQTVPDVTPELNPVLSPVAIEENFSQPVASASAQEPASVIQPISNPENSLGLDSQNIDVAEPETKQSIPFGFNPPTEELGYAKNQTEVQPVVAPGSEFVPKQEIPVGFETEVEVPKEFTPYQGTQNTDDSNAKPPIATDDNFPGKDDPYNINNFSV